MNNYIKEIRSELGFTAEEFQIKLGLSQGTYSKMENNKSGISTATRRILVNELNVNPIYLDTGKGEILLNKHEENSINQNHSSDNEMIKRLIEIITIDKENVKTALENNNKANDISKEAILATREVIEANKIAAEANRLSSEASRLANQAMLVLSNAIKESLIFGVNNVSSKAHSRSRTSGG